MSGAIVSCKKEEPDDTFNADTEMAADMSHAEGAFDDINNIADQSSMNMLVSYKKDETIAASCAVITHDTTSNPKILTIDFGTTNCLCKDGRIRRGKIIASYSGTYKGPGSSVTFTTQNYFVNDFQILGTKTVANSGRNSNNNLSYTITVNGQVVSPDKADTIYWTSNRIREWAAGENTWSWLDDVYLITGTGNCSNGKGNSFSVDITTALRKEINCRYLVSGILEIKPATGLARVIDYGNGTCDDKAMISVGSQSRQITLR